LWWALAGVMIGLVLAVIAGRLMAGLLYHVGPTDPVTFIGVPLVLTFVALIACIVPAVRAMRVNPITALRTE
jgi:ABC-type antimicrobial peptide transport system permease subunit